MSNWTNTGSTQANFDLFAFDPLSHTMYVADRTAGHLDGVQCSGRNGHGLGVDTVQDFIYVGPGRYPADPNSSTTGANGIPVLYDPAPPTQPLTTRTQTALAAMNGSTAQGSVKTYIVGRAVRMDPAATVPGGVVWNRLRGRYVLYLQISPVLSTCWSRVRSHLPLDFSTPLDEPSTASPS